MGRVLFFAIALLTVTVMLPLSSALADVDDGSTIKITSPQDGAKVGDTFELKYEPRKDLRLRTVMSTWTASRRKSSLVRSRA